MPRDAKVLVVDDDPVTRTCLAEYFAAENYDVMVAETAEEAGRIASTRDVDLVLLDIRLPGKDGLTLTRELRVLSVGNRRAAAAEVLAASFRKASNNL
ncbi:MAG: response regulator [Betaproteobacteria bacterium]|nr:MAG: response regulator [Betaproteobacteria bacterium]